MTSPSCSDTALKDPTMYVQISLDKSQAGGVHERAILDKYSHEMTGNSVAIAASERGAINHRKMVIVDARMAHRRVHELERVR